MEGASSDSPAATVRMASVSWPARTSLSRKPLAPARSASYTHSLRSKVVSTSTRGGSGVASTWRVAASPSTRGIRTSMSTTSGRCRRASATASTPSAASATTCRSGSRSISDRKPSRTRAWSSASRTQINSATAGTRESSAGRRAAHREPAARRRRRHAACRRRGRPVRACRPDRARRRPDGAPPSAGPRASSTHRTTTPSSSLRSATCTRAPGACLAALVSASCTIRYSVSSKPAERGPAGSTAESSTSRPAARARSISAGRWRSPGLGASGLRAVGPAGPPGLEQAEHAAHLAERVARGRLDRVEVAVEFGGLAVLERRPGGQGLQDDHRQPVADDVVQLARDPGSFDLHGDEVGPARPRRRAGP